MPPCRPKPGHRTGVHHTNPSASGTRVSLPSAWYVGELPGPPDNCATLVPPAEGALGLGELTRAGTVQAVNLAAPDARLILADPFERRRSQGQSAGAVGVCSFARMGAASG